jgi:ribonuclease PH
MIYRSDNRALEQMRPVNIEPDFISTAEGSCLIEVGNTRVICTASVDEAVPSWMRNSGKGWVTSEYGMLPRSTLTRTAREANRGRQSGRTHEIQRLIGRSLRAVTDLEKLGERTIFLDCDVIQADGGTRTMAINGAFIALADALAKMKKDGLIAEIPLLGFVGAISVGKLRDDLVLDLNYEEDSKADVDMNIVMNDKGEYIEVQGTSEGKTFKRDEMDKLLDLAQKGIQDIISIQKRLLGK